MRGRFALFAFLLGTGGAGCSLIVSYDGYGDGVRGDDGGDTTDGTVTGDGATAGDGSSQGDASEGGTDAADGGGGDASDAGDAGDAADASDAGKRYALVVLGGTVIDGGTSSGVTNVEYAMINPDGTLAPFVDGTPLPYAENRIGAAAWGSSIFINDDNGGYAAVMLPDGGMSSWLTIASVARSEARLAAFEGQLYLATGEASNDTEAPEVWRTTITGPQTISGWTATTPLPTGGPRSESTMVLDPVERRLYLVGGDLNDVDIGSVMSAPIVDGGAVGTWTENTALPGVGDKTRTVIVGRQMTILGGSFDALGDSNVYTATIQAGGTLAAWQLGVDHPAPVDDRAYAVHGQFAYLIGGSSSDVNTGTVHVTTISPVTGFPGTWATTSALKRPRQSMSAVAVELP